jgi:triosephosphate isomerase (TIM)
VRRPFIAGNWKMNTTRSEALQLVQGLSEALASVDTVDVAVCPPSVYLDAVAAALRGSKIAWVPRICTMKPGGLTRVS